MVKNTGMFLISVVAVCATACDDEPNDPCEKYCTRTLDHCGPGTRADVEACTSACRADMEDKEAVCVDSFEAYADCLWEVSGCDAPQCDGRFELWAHDCYATGDLAGPFELEIAVEPAVTGTWVPGDPDDVLTCEYPITATAVRGGIARWDAVDWFLESIPSSSFCGAGLKVNAGLIDFWGSDLIKAGETQTALAQQTCHEEFEARWRFDYLDPDGVLQSVDATVICLEP